MNYMDFAPHLIRERNQQVHREVRLATARASAARGSRIERFAVRCPRQEGREAAAARGTPRGVAMVT